MERNRNNYIHHVIYSKIQYNVEEIKKHYSFVLLMLLFVVFCLFAMVTKLIVGEFVPDDFQDVANAVLYLLLYVLICVISFLIKNKAKDKNGGKNPFEAKELENITLKSLTLTGIFYFAFSVKEVEMSSFPFVGVLLTLLLGFIFSLNEGLQRDDVSGLAEYLRQSIVGFVNSCSDSIWIIAITAIPLNVGTELLMEKKKTLFWVLYGCVFVFAMILWFLDGISYLLILKRIRSKITNQSVLILDYSHHRILTSKIVKLVKGTKGDYEIIKKGEIFHHQYDVIIIVDELAHQTKLLQDAKTCLAEDGIIIAPAYTTRRGKSDLISKDEYKEKIIKQRMSISKISLYRFIGVTYMEIKKKSNDERK